MYIAWVSKGSPLRPSPVGSRCLIALAALLAPVPAQAAGALATPDAVGIAKFAVALAAAAVLLWGEGLRRSGRPARRARLRNGLLIGLGLLGALGWTNFLQFRYEPGFGHPQDVFHYYIGAKYFDELRYTRLYACTTVADAESGLADVAARRSIRNLESYRRESAAIVLADPGACTRNFSSERWETFKHDVGWFRERIPEPLWQGMLADHGYNPSPVWGAVGLLFIGDGPVSEVSLAPLLLIDPLLLIAMWAAVWRSFGWRALCVGLVFWGTNLPDDYLWTGGAFLRAGWIATLVIGICCLRDRRMLTAGALMTTAALLRIFPALAVGGVVLSAALDLLRRRSLRLSAAHRRFAVGCVAAMAVLGTLSVATAGGVRAWDEFARNLQLHSRALFATNVGLKSFLAYDFDTPLERRLRGEESAPNATIPARIATYEGRRWIHVAAALAWLALLVRAARQRPDWEAAVLAAGGVVLLATMSNYYYGVLLGFALLERRGGPVGAGLCALAALTWAVDWSTDAFDQAYAWISLATVAFVLAATALWPRHGPEEPPAEVSAPA